MMLQLVTDGRRLAGSDDLERVSAAVATQARAAAAAGVDQMQIREGWLDALAMQRLVDAVRAATRGSGIQVLVNDRLDVALAAGADGVHLKSGSFTVAEARRLAPPGFLIGRSVHTAGDARRADGADYLIAGTVWPTASKPAGHAWLGLEGLREIVAAVGVPVLAIGGVTFERAAEIAATGAAGIAGIGLFAADGLAARVAAIRRAFDTSAGAS